MFDSLQTRLGTVFDRLRGRGALSEADVETALGEVRRPSIADLFVAVMGHTAGQPKGAAS